ncbi:MAG: adenylate/guanylate cyclase domain-containing protein [bacterium]
MNPKHRILASFCCWFLFHIAQPAHAQVEGKIIFPKLHSYHAGDNTTWAQPEFNDSDWEKIKFGDFPHSRWQGIGWFRYVLEVDSALWNSPLGLTMEYTGAVEFYLEGNLLYQFGRVGTSKEDEKPYLTSMPELRALAFPAPSQVENDKSRHLIAIRYSSFFLELPLAAGVKPGFDFKIGDLQQMSNQHDIVRTKVTTHQMLLMGILLAFALLHLLFFLFYPQLRQNLYFAALTAFLALTIYFWFRPALVTGAPMQFVMALGWRNTALTFSMLFFIRLTYALIFHERPKLFALFCVVGLGLTLWCWFRPLGALIYLISFYIAALVEIVRTLTMAWMKKRVIQLEGSWMILAGMIPFALTGAYWFLIALEVAPEPWDFFEFPTPFYAILILMISMSVFLARNFAQTNKNLEAQLVKVSAIEKEVRRTRDVFRLFVPDAVLDRIAKQGLESIKLGGAEEGIATILFTDIRSFTSIAEKLSPNETLAFLNEFMQRMEPVIHRNGGFINQFVGDEIMAIFYLTGHENAAIETAIAVRQALDEHNRERTELGEPAIDIGVGVNTGKVIWGTIGSEVRMESAIIGDTVNLASRLQNLTKHYGVGVLVSESAFREISNPERYCHREVDVVQVRGKTKPVVIYEFFDSDPEPVKALKIACLSPYYRGLHYFHAEDWPQAMSLFNECLAIFPEDPISHIHFERCRERIAKRRSSI